MEMGCGPAMRAILLIFSFCLFCRITTNAQKASDGSSAYTFSGNNNHLVGLMREGGDPMSAGGVKIEFYGHACFKVTSPMGLELADKHQCVAPGGNLEVS